MKSESQYKEFFSSDMRTPLAIVLLVISDLHISNRIGVLSFSVRCKYFVRLCGYTFFFFFEKNCWVTGFLIVNRISCEHVLVVMLITFNVSKQEHFC